VRSSLALFSNFTFFLNDPLNGDQFQQSERRSYGGASLSQTWTAPLAGHARTTTTGIQFRSDRISPVALYRTAHRDRLGVVREDRVTTQTIAPYASNTFTWTAWLRTLAGLRADYYRFSVDSDNAANSGRTGDSLVSPKLSFVLGPWRSTEYFVNFGRGFHSNDARGTTMRIDPATGGTAEPVPALVRTRGRELGLRSQPAPGFTASLALWELEQDSELLFVGDAGTTEPSRPSRRRGIEWLAQYALGASLAVDVSFAATRARFSDPNSAGNHIPGAPDRVASAGVTMPDFGGWFGSLRWRYFGPRPLIEDASIRSRSSSLVNARLGYAFDRRTRVSADVYNLFDRKDNDVEYYYESRLPGEAAPVADVHFHPVERRSVRLTLTLHL
jgi:outer membrane receptor protein involved in Fe transport